MMSDFAARRTMMVDTQVRPSDVTKFPIIAALLRVRREMFVPASLREAAYVGANLDLGGGRVLLEARTLAKMLDALDISPTDMVLDIGSGAGYSAAVIGQLAVAVVAVEQDEAMAAAAGVALAAEGCDNVFVVAGPMAAGAPGHGPYDVIMLQGAAEFVPDALIAQLKEGGRIACLFMEGALGVCRIGYKRDGMIDWRFAFNASAPVLPGFSKAREFVL